MRRSIKKAVRFVVVFFLLSGFLVHLKAQSANSNRFDILEQKLNEIANQSTGLNEKVELSVSGVAIQEFIRGMAVQNNININVDPGLSISVISNFTDVPVKEVLLFLCKKYDLDLTFTGSIISVIKYVPPIAEKPAYIPKKLKIEYNSYSDLLSMDLNNDSLQVVAREITRLSNKNVVYSPDLSNKLVSGFIKETAFASAIDKFAFANDLKASVTEDHFYLLEKKDATSNALNKTGGGMGGTKKTGTPPAGLKIKSDSIGLLNIDAIDVELSDLVDEVCNQLKINYYLFSELKGKTNLKVSSVGIEDFFKKVFNGTDYTFRRLGQVYLLGKRDLEGLRSSKLVQFRYRTAEKIVDFIPADLKKGVDLKVFPELNSLIISGSAPATEELEAFLRELDRVVPLIQIEVMIVDINDTKTLSTGIEAGLGTSPAVTGGVMFPTADVTLSANSINNFLSGISAGAVNLGQVTPNFYIRLKAMESQGAVKIRSTPMLATLNGHEAKMTIGDKEYYLETSTILQGSVAATAQTAQTWKPVDADLELIITPVVSADDQITLDVKFKQSSFTARISQTAPPGTTTRNFQSLVRVKNRETILLGGLEEDEKNDTGSGVPLLSRIPVIKWLFSSRTKANSKKRLSIFIKPTVLY